MADLNLLSDSASLAGLYAQLSARAQEPPPISARSVSIAGQACGWVTQAACDALRGLDGVRVIRQGLHIARDECPGPRLNALLARIADMLRQADCLPGWRHELLDIRAGEQHLGVIERAAMRPLGLSTQAVHLNAWTLSGDLWIARRALSKPTNPGMWDTLVGGLVGAGENPDDALVRECGEEAGLDPGDLSLRTPLRTIFRMNRRLPEGYQVEDVLVSRCVLAESIRPANRDGEVSAIATVDRATALRMVRAGEFTLEAALVIVDDLKR